MVEQGVTTHLLTITLGLSIHITLTLEKLLILYSHVNSEKLITLYSHANLHKKKKILYKTISNFIHHFIYQKFFENPSFSFTTFSLLKEKSFY